MFTYHASNRLEDLADGLIAAGRSLPLSPFEARVVVCESPALARWLRYRFCRRVGVACLLDTPLPAAWLWARASEALGLGQHEDPLSRERLRWRLFAALGREELVRDERAGVVARYLADDGDGLKRWQFAGRLADLFDRYQYYRPELIRHWSQGGGEDWQALLWRAVAEGVEDHRVALMDRFLARLEGGEAPALPARIDLFALHALPPLLLRAFAAVGRHTEVVAWLLSPTPEYWADLASPRALARQRREAPERAELWQAGNPLLTQWGRQGQMFQDQLLDDAVGLGEGGDHFTPPGRDRLLHHLQSDLFEALAPGRNTPREVEEPFETASIQFHLCHGALRECQVLRDTLLHLLAADETLEPEEILVLVPEIGRYAPYIEAVFGGAEQENRLPFNISDALLPDEHPLIRAFLDLLALPESRFSRAEVLGLANTPEIRARFGLDEADLAELADRIDHLNLYWGLDGASKRRLGLPEIDDNTWHQGFMRMMAGFAIGEETLIEERGDPIAPLAGIQAGEAERIARLFDLLDALRRWSTLLARPATPAGWAERLGRLVEHFFAPTAEGEERLARIFDALSELEQAEEAGVGELAPEVVRAWLGDLLENRNERGRLYSGGITFCAMKPLRGVPFRVVAMLGMQESAFPRRTPRNEFDRMRQQWRHGDPDPVHEDRYLFLEALLAARDHLVISYTGRDASTNEPLQPSVVVGELLDYLRRHYRIGGRPADEALTRIHPLHPFSAANFEPPAPGFDLRWLALARAVADHRPPSGRPGWPATAIEPEERAPAAERQLSPAELARFLKDPVGRFARERLRVREARDLELIEEEPLDTDGLASWQLCNLILQCRLQGEPADRARRLARARGMLPHGLPGERSFDAALEKAEAILSRCPALGIELPLARRGRDVDLILEGDAGPPWRLAGRLSHTLEGGGAVAFSASSFHLGRLLPLWVEHLCLHAEGGGSGSASLFFHAKGACRLPPLEQAEARHQLRTLLALYEEGSTRPLPLPIETGAIFFDKRSEDETEAWRDARTAWASDRGGRTVPECQKFPFPLVLQGHDWCPGSDEQEFAGYAERLFGPLKAHLEELK